MRPSVEPAGPWWTLTGMRWDDSATDAQLLAAADVADGFGVLFDRHANAVYNHCFRLTSNWSVAEDLTSVVFLAAWRRRRSVVLDGESMRPWLLGVATNVARNHARSLRRYRAALARLPVPRAQPDPADDVAARLDDEAVMRGIWAKLHGLPATQQDVVALCVWAGLSYQEAAIALGIPIGTVRSRLARARSRLRQIEGQGRTASHQPPHRSPANDVEEACP